MPSIATRAILLTCLLASAVSGGPAAAQTLSARTVSMQRLVHGDLTLRLSNPWVTGAHLSVSGLVLKIEDPTSSNWVRCKVNAVAPIEITESVLVGPNWFGLATHTADPGSVVEFLSEPDGAGTYSYRLKSNSRFTLYECTVTPI